MRIQYEQFPHGRKESHHNSRQSTRLHTARPASFASGHKIIGVEFDETTVKELFEESGIEIAKIEQKGGLQLFASHDDRY